MTLQVQKTDEFRCDCGSSEFYEGPRGGAAQNFKCARCGKVYNIVPLSNGCIGVEKK